MPRMSLRLGYWLGGLVVVLILSCSIPWDPALSEVGPGVAVLGWALAGVVGEMVALMRAVRARPTPIPMIDSRPADGEVGLATMLGVRAEANTRDGRFDDCRAGARRSPHRRGHPGREAVSAAAGSGRLALGLHRPGRPGLVGRGDRAGPRRTRTGRAGGSNARRSAGRLRSTWRLADTYFAADDPDTDDVEVAFVPQGDRMEPFEAGRGDQGPDRHEPRRGPARIPRRAPTGSPGSTPGSRPTTASGSSTRGGPAARWRSPSTTPSSPGSAWPSATPARPPSPSPWSAPRSPTR